MRRVVQATAVIAAVMLLAVLLTNRPGDPRLFPPRGGTGIAVMLVSNGFHTGLVLPVPALSDIASARGLPAILSVAARFVHYDWVEFGWGEDAFYRAAPSPSSVDWRSAIRALFRPGNASVMHVVGIEGDPAVPFRGADTRWIHLSRDGLERLVAGVDASFARGPDGRPDVLGTGLYGPSLFFRGVGTFSILNLCNHWTARRLNEAGLPVSLGLATLPRGLMLDLAIRSSR